VVLIFLLSFSLKAQSYLAKLEKNKNVDAKELIHYLNETRDTLILESHKKINYLYTINKNYGREYDLYVNANSYKLPLRKLSKGKHVMVAVQSPKRIVFVVHILQDLEQEESLVQNSSEASGPKPNISNND
jgi:hypothetical protein